MSMAHPLPAAPAGDALAEFQAAFARHRCRARLAGIAVAATFLLLLIVTAWMSDLFRAVPVTLHDGSRVQRWILWAGLPRLDEYVAKTMPDLHWATLGHDLRHWFWRAPVWIGLLVETVLIAFFATMLSVVCGFLLSFPAARNLSPGGTVLWISRRYLEVARTVPDLVWALIFVFCFGVGPMAGVMAIALHGTGSLGKLYSEVNENIDMRPLDAVRAVGGTWFDAMRYGVVPQVLPNILSYTLLRFEINVRSSSIIGYVGAGGLGQELRTAVSLQEYTDLSALFLMVLVAVAVIDRLSDALRHRIIAREAVL